MRIGWVVVAAGWEGGCVHQAADGRRMTVNHSTASSAASRGVVSPVGSNVLYMLDRKTVEIFD